MEFTGRIIAVLPSRSGAKKDGVGTWMMQEYVIQETQGEYPKKMCFNVFGEDKIKSFNIQVGQELTVSFDVNAREYQGRWYNDIRVWKVEQAQGTAPQQAQQAPMPAPQAQPQAPQAVQGDMFEQDSNDPNLPF